MANISFLALKQSLLQCLVLVQERVNLLLVSGYGVDVLVQFFMAALCQSRDDLLLALDQQRLSVQLACPFNVVSLLKYCLQIFH